MTIRNLDSLFKPDSVALIGASSKPASVGSEIARGLLAGNFGGAVMPVNPAHPVVHGVIAYPDVASLPMTPDLAVICTPPDTVPGLIGALGDRGTKGAVVITAGFGEEGTAHGQALRKAVLEAARPHLMRIIGPNCLGILVPNRGLNASFAPAAPVTGKLAFVAQSGAVLTSIIDWAEPRDIGFSHLVSLGDMIDVDFGDMLDYLANDQETSAILLYIESVTGARKFMSAARAAARMKPVIVVKAGRFAEGARAASSHTGALAGSDDVYEAVFNRAGILRVVTLTELFDAVEILAKGYRPSGDRLAIVSNGGGIGVLATDALMAEHGRLAELQSETIAKLDHVLPPTWSGANPVDIIGDATGARYADALDAVLEDRNVDAVLVLNCPTAITSSSDAAEAVVKVAERHPKKPVLTSWIGGTRAGAARPLLTNSGKPTYETPEQAVRAFMHLARYRRNQELLTETPPSVPEAFKPDRQRAACIIDRVLQEDRSWLMEPEAKEVLEAYEIPVGKTVVAASPNEVGQVAETLGFPVALKILSPDIIHKSDVGGVALNIGDAREAVEGAKRMQDTVRRARPDVEKLKFVVEPMITRPDAHELIAGVYEDRQFGPVLLFGQGGTAVEVVNDKSLGLPPLNLKLAQDLIARTRVYNLLQGFRDQPPADLDAVALTLMKISQLVIDFAEIAELDVNPLLADTEGVCALDARIRVSRAEGRAVDRLTIRPYPKELEETVDLRDDRILLIRPIVPEDEPALMAGFAKLSSEEVRLRFLAPMKALSHLSAARFTQLDYDRDMALVLSEPGIPGRSELFGVVRISADPDNETAEFAIVIRREMTGRGLGAMLMQRIIDYARRRGIGEIFGIVMRENTKMLGLCEKLGFTRQTWDGDTKLYRVGLKL